MLTQLEDLIVRMEGLSLLVGVALLSIETLLDLIRWHRPGRRLLETLASLSTQIPYVAGELLFATATVILYFTVYELVTPVAIPVTLGTLGAGADRG